ncbi:MAG: response regulator transcription factor [Alcanivorax sp.]|nr:response regulator transcription factor [Alcanivorax sp.]
MKAAIIVEDHDDTREWMTTLLGDAFPNISVTTASTVAGGLAALQKDTFSLALLDISLPDGNGVTLVEWLRHRAPDTYIVMATIFDDDDHLFTALRAGAHGYLLKDQPRERLIEQLCGILRGEPPLSASIARRMMRHFRQSHEPERDDTLLTEREREVLGLLARGFTRTDISAALGIAANTVATYTKSIYRKLGVSGRAEAALEAVRLGVVRRDG